MDGAGAGNAAGEAWSAVASEWAELWGSFADPVRERIIELTGIRSGSRVLDVGCGSGEFLALLERRGAQVAGIDPAPAMVARARSLVSTGDVRLGIAESLPWQDSSYDVITAVNAVQFAEDAEGALAEFGRVAVPGGFVAIANWAEAARNDLNVIESAVALSFDEDPMPDDAVRLPGGLERLVADAGFDVVASGLVELPWQVQDEDRLVRGVLLGEDEAGLAAGAATVIEAAQPFRRDDGGYRLAQRVPVRHRAHGSGKPRWTSPSEVRPR